MAPSALVVAGFGGSKGQPFLWRGTWGAEPARNSAHPS